MAQQLTAMHLSAIGAQIKHMQDGLNSLHLGSADEGTILEQIATDAEEVAAFVRQYVQPAPVKKAKPEEPAPVEEPVVEAEAEALTPEEDWMVPPEEAKKRKNR